MMFYKHCGILIATSARPWSKLEGSITAAFTWISVLRPSGKTDQFRLNPIQSCAPRRRCDRVSSASPPRTRDVLRHLLTCDQSSCLFHARLPTITSIPAPTQTNIAMTNYTHAPTVNNPSAFSM